MLESGSSGSVRGVLSNEHPYRDPNALSGRRNSCWCLPCCAAGRERRAGAGTPDHHRVLVCRSCAATSVKPAMTYHSSPSPSRSVNYIRPGRERTWSSRGFLLGILAILLVIAALACAVTSQVSRIATAPTIGSALSTMEHGHPRTP